MTPALELEIFKAYDKIHALGVIHGDVRVENILVDRTRKAVWIVDFEFSEVVTGNVDAQSRIDGENHGVKYLLSEIKRGVKDHRNGGTRSENSYSQSE